MAKKITPKAFLKTMEVFCSEKDLFYFASYAGDYIYELLCDHGYGDGADVFMQHLLFLTSADNYDYDDKEEKCNYDDPLDERW